MVSTSQPMATQVGLDILRRGGNAMDAAIAAGATLCVTEPQSTGLGGDCFLLYHQANSGELYGLNGSGRAPARATLAEFQRRGHTAVPERDILAVTVPGAIDAWQTALERFGSMDFGEVLGPAIDYAENGYAVSPVVAKFWARHQELLSECNTSRAALLINGQAPPAGSRHCQPNLGRSMRRVAENGRDVFYKGEIAEEIVSFSDKLQGLLTLDDLADHTSTWVEPIHTDYHGLRVCELPPNGVGVTVLMILNILENTTMGDMEHLSPAHIHTLTEAYRLAEVERNRYVSDPEFSDVPISAMLSKEFAKDQWLQIDPKRALGYPLTSNLPGHRDTVYLTVVDAQRNAVSFINSLFQMWGSGVVAGDTGIMLQNRGAGFNLMEGHTNCIAPRKRPRHTIIPAMVYRDDRPILSYGVMGGDYQAMGHSYVLTNWLDFGMDLQEALDAPRFLPTEQTLTVENPIPESTREALQDLGHEVVVANVPFGGGQCIHIDWDNGVLQAASDPRKDGCALGY